MARPSIDAKLKKGTEFSDYLSGTTEEDVLFGYAGDDIIFGGDGRDFLYGGDGDDALYGEDGDDYLDGGAGADTLDGGSGFDSVNYHGSGSAVYINLQSLTASGGEAEGDTLIGIEYARGSHYDDTLIGNNGANFLCGLGGDDAMYGRGGDDILRGAEDADHLDGGSGKDAATYWSSSSAVTVDLESGTGSAGHAAGDTLVSIEIVLGSEFWGDTLGAASHGSDLYGKADMLFGEAGNDTLDGGEGDDLITAGEGNDTITGGAGGDQFKFRQGDGIDVITDFEAGSDRIIFSDHQTTWRDLTTVMDGDNAVIRYGDDDVLTVNNATLGDVWDSFGFY